MKKFFDIAIPQMGAQYVPVVLQYNFITPAHSLGFSLREIAYHKKVLPTPGFFLPGNLHVSNRNPKRPIRYIASTKDFSLCIAPVIDFKGDTKSRHSLLPILIFVSSLNPHNEKLDVFPSISGYSAVVASLFTMRAVSLLKWGRLFFSAPPSNLRIVGKGGESGGANTPLRNEMEPFSLGVQQQYTTQGIVVKEETGITEGDYGRD